MNKWRTIRSKLEDSESIGENHKRTTNEAIYPSSWRWRNSQRTVVVVKNEPIKRNGHGERI